MEGANLYIYIYICMYIYMYVFIHRRGARAGQVDMMEGANLYM